MSTAALRPLGFVLLMIGFGLRLDTAWQGVAWLVLAAGAACTIAAFVPGRGRR